MSVCVFGWIGGTEGVYVPVRVCMGWFRGTGGMYVPVRGVYGGG